MTVTNTFKASGIQTAETLRRAINTAFISLTNQLNQEETVVRQVESLPTGEITEGRIVLLTTADGDNAAGFYGYRGNSWRRLE